MFFDCIDKIRIDFNVNLINQVYDQLPTSSKNYLERYTNQTQSKAYGKTI